MEACKSGSCVWEGSEGVARWDLGIWGGLAAAGPGIWLLLDEGMFEKGKVWLEARSPKYLTHVCPRNGKYLAAGGSEMAPAGLSIRGIPGNQGTSILDSRVH